MRLRLLSLVLIVACGGSPKSTTPPPTLPDDPKVATEQKPAPASEEAPPPAEPEPKLPEGPLDLPLPMPKTEVKLVSAGKGKKQKLVVSPKAGAKQTAAWTLDLLMGQDVPPERGGKREEISTIATFVGETEIKEVDATSGQAKYQLTVASADAVTKPGVQMPADAMQQFKDGLQSLIGATVSGTVDANGTTGDLALHVEKPDAKVISPVQLLQLAALPMWPALPNEPIGPGAKWTVTSTQTVGGMVEVTKVVTYELVGKKGKAWTIKGTTQVSGKDQQPQPGAKIVGIAGDGAHEITLTDGAVLPTFKQAFSTTFNINITPTKPDASGKTDPFDIKVWINVGNAVEPK